MTTIDEKSARFEWFTSDGFTFTGSDGQTWHLPALMGCFYDAFASIPRFWATRYVETTIEEGDEWMVTDFSDERMTAICVRSNCIETLARQLISINYAVSPEQIESILDGPEKLWSLAFDVACRYITAPIFEAIHWADSEGLPRSAATLRLLHPAVDIGFFSHDACLFEN